MSLYVKRCRHDIFAEIIESLLEKPKRVTKLSYGVGLPLDRIKRVLGYLEYNGLLVREDGEYRVTRAGIEYLQTYIKLKSLLDRVE